MQKIDMSKKNIIWYFVILIASVLLILFANEGKRPLEYTGERLLHGTGLIDSDGALLVGETTAASGNVAYTQKLVVNRGNYVASIEYMADEEGSVLELWEQGKKIAGWPIMANQDEINCEFNLSQDTKALQLRINYGGQGSLRVKKVGLTPQGIFYTDSYFLALVVLVFGVLFFYLYDRQKRKPSGMQGMVDFAIMIGVTLLATSPMFQTYLHNGDDLCYHLARMEGIKDGILDGQFGVIILPEGLNGNGYLNVMYPYLFLYPGAFLRICRVSLALSYKVTIFLANLGSAVCAYYALKSMVKSRRSVILGVVLYTLMPYRFTNIFSRGDLGETLALIFWPMVIAGLYHILLGNREKWYYLVIGFSGVFQSHILSATFVTGICFITVLVYCKKLFEDKRYIDLCKAAGLTVLLNFWYIVPFMYYFVREDIGKDVLRWGSYFEQSVNLSFMTQSISLYNKQYFSLGLALLGCVGIGVIYLVCEYNKEKEDINGFLGYLMIMGCLMTVMCTGYFPNRAIADYAFLQSIATMVQFPWRFLGPAATCFMFVGVVAFSKSKLLENYKKIIFGLLIGLNLLVIISVPADNNHMPYVDRMAAASKGHESKMVANIGLFYPHEWRLTDIIDEELTTSVVVSDDEEVFIYDFAKKGTKAQVTYATTVSNGYVEVPIQKYMGYHAKDENGNKVEITQGYGGRIRFVPVADGQQHTVYVRFGPVPIFVIANLVSALTIIGIVIIWWKKRSVLK